MDHAVILSVRRYVCLPVDLLIGFDVLVYVKLDDSTAGGLGRC